MSVPTQIDVFKNSYSDSVHLLLEQAKSLGGISKNMLFKEKETSLIGLGH